MNKTCTIFLIVILFINNIIIAQNEDNLWMMGYTSFIIPEHPDPDSLMGCIFFDFNNDPVRIYRDGEQYMSFQEEMTSMCDSAGKLLFYSNGMFINNSEYKVMEGGDSIAYGEFWERFVDTIYPTTYEGLRIWQGALSLPYPGHSGKYIMLYEDWDIHRQLINHVYYAIIDINENGGLGRVIEKDVDLLVQNNENEWLADWGKLTACKHANGRDWWVMIPNSINNKIYIYLLSPEGLNLIMEKEFEAYRVSKSSLGQGAFSPDGKYYAIWGGDEILGKGYYRLYDFDRCTGELSNERSDTLLTIYGDGLCFSPNSNYLYLSNDKHIYQFDLEEDDFYGSKQIVATMDTIWENEIGRKLSLSWMALGRDKKIYVIPNAGNSSHIHRINKPDEKGESCNVQHHILKLPTFVGTAGTIPNYPNFRLGPIDGSDCDTLGIDNIPVSKFSYEQDSIDYLTVQFTDLSYFEPEQYSWDFGDGVTSTEVNPQHNFLEKGIYEVCLTVTNINATNTSCRKLNIGAVYNQEYIDNKIRIDLFPNPVDDILLVTISDYLPQDATIEFYSLDGEKVMTKKIRYGWNSIDMRNLSAGMYFYRVIDYGGKLQSSNNHPSSKLLLLKSGKVVVK